MPNVNAVFSYCRKASLVLLLAGFHHEIWAQNRAKNTVTNAVESVQDSRTQLPQTQAVSFTQLGVDINGEAASDQAAVVALSSNGDVLAIGAYGNDGAGASAGHVRVFTWNGSAWVQRGSDIDGSAAGDLSGSSVSLSSNGSVVAIGAPYNSVNGFNAGLVRVYTWNGSSWVKTGADILGQAARDQMGTRVNLSDDGTVLSMGGGQYDVNGAGVIRVFKWNGSSWVQRGANILGEAAGDKGAVHSLSADGSVVAIGSAANAGNGSLAGHVRVFAWNGSNWIKRGADIDGASANRRFGTSVSLSADGTILAAGAPVYSATGSGTAGHVEVYRWDGTAWSQRGADITGEANLDEFGTAVSLSDDGIRLSIGAPGNDGRGSAAGHVRVYSWSGTAWVKQGADLDGEAANDNSGQFVHTSSNGKTIAIGAVGNAGNGSFSGHVRVYQLSDPTITLTGTFSPFTTMLGTLSSIQSISLSGSDLTEAVTVTVPAGFEVRKGTSGVFSASTSITPVSGVINATTVQVRMTGSTAGDFSGSLSAASTGATTKTVAVSGTVTVPTPTITLSGTFSEFSSTVGTPSAAQNITISASNLTANLVVTAPDGYEIRLGTAGAFASSETLIPSGGTVPSTTVQVRLTGSTSGTFNGSLTAASTGATSQTLAVSGVVSDQVLIASYPFSGNADDATGNAHHGSVVGATLTSDRFNNDANAYSFDGNSSILLPNALQNPLTTTNFTVSMWMKPGDVENARNFFVGIKSFHQHIYPSMISWRIFQNSTEDGFDLNIALPRDTWSLLTWTYNGSMMYWYKDGLVQDSHAVSGPLDAPINQAYTLGELSYIGAMDEVRIYNFALSPQQVQELAGSVAPTLSVFLPLNGSSSDSLGTRYPLLANDLLPAADRFGERRTAARFNGSSSFIALRDSSAFEVSSYTISLWVKWDGVGNTVHFLTGKGPEQFELHTGGLYNQQLRFIPTAGVFLDTEAGVLPVDEWAHVAAVYDPANGRGEVYVNGQRKAVTNNGSSPLTTPIGRSSEPFFIGKRHTNQYHFSGLIDGFRLEGRALSGSEILDQYNEEVYRRDYQTITFTGSVNMKRMLEIGAAVPGDSLYLQAYSGLERLNGFDGANFLGILADEQYEYPISIETGNKVREAAFQGEFKFVLLNRARMSRFAQANGAMYEPTPGTGDFANRHFSVEAGEQSVLLGAFHWNNDEREAMAAPVQLAPDDNAINLDLPVELVWKHEPYAIRYHISVGTSTGWEQGTFQHFSLPVETLAFRDGNPVLWLEATDLLPETQYFWRMDAWYDSVATFATHHRSFTTGGGAPVDLIRNLLVHYQFNGDSRDASGNANHATASDVSATSDRFGQTDQAFAFNGSSSLVTVVQDVPEDGGTVSMWFKTSAAFGGLFQTTDGVSGHDRNVYINSGKLFGRIWEEETIGNSTLSVVDNEWHHVVYTYGTANRGQTLYLDGNQIARGTMTTSSFAGQKSIEIGRSLFPAESYFSGSMDDIRVYSRSFTAAEVDSLFKLESTPNGLTLPRLPLTFEATNISWNDAILGFGGGSLTLVDNPDPSGINTSSRVARMVKGAGDPWAGAFISLGEPVDLSVSDQFKLKVWSPRVGAAFLFKLENLTMQSEFHEVSQLTTVANAWQELTFDMSGANRTWTYQKVTFILDLGTIGNGSSDFTIYFDDLNYAVESNSYVSVWPGDTNLDETVTAADLLPISRYYGLTAPASEPAAGISWRETQRLSWQQDAGSPSRVHADADGSGTINADDLLALGANYGKVVGTPDPATKSAVLGDSLHLTAVVSKTVNGTRFTIRPKTGESQRFSGISVRLEHTSFANPKAKAEFEQVASTNFNLLSLARLLPKNNALEASAVFLSTDNKTVPAPNATLLIEGIFLPADAIRTRSVRVLSANGELIPASITFVDESETVSNEPVSLPKNMVLKQNYPNPFNPSTMVGYALPEMAQVTLEIFDIQGRSVSKRILGTLPAGSYQTSIDLGQLYAGGLYFYRLTMLTAGGRAESQTRKMTLIK